MGVDLGDKVTLITPQAQVTPAGILPRMRRFTVVGVFSVGMYEYDRATAFVHLNDGARLMKLKDEVSSVRLKLEDMFAAPELSYELNQSMGDQYWITDWTKQHANFFRAVKTEKRVMFFILLLIVAVAAFNIVSTLVMLVNDKRSDIAILRTLGLTPGQVMGVFMVQGVLIGLIGTALGILSGVALAANVETIVPAIESFFNTKFLAPDVYYISDLPSDLRSADVLTVGLVAFFASMIMTLYPAWQASRTQPVEALRYE
jgi:lipoprotein-releasing system permease protein